MTKQKQYIRIMMLMVCSMIFVSNVSLFQMTASAAVPKLNTIRVALFLDTDKYHLNSPKVSLLSDQGLSIGIRTDTGVRPWLDHVLPSKIRLSVDQFRVQLMETFDYAQAQKLLQQLNESDEDVTIFKRMKQGKPLFQVWVGSYATKELATIARESMISNVLLPPLMKSSITPSRITGSQRLNAGSFASVTEAVYQQTAIHSLGIEADIVYHENATGSLLYSIWIGNEPDMAGLNVLKQQVNKLMPALILQAVDNNLPYLIRREDQSDGVSELNVFHHYLFNRTGQKVWITPKQGKTKINEKASQSYRGSIEVSQNNGKLAVINELPFEQYLYSVVGKEMGTGWPLEALKAQAVAARTYSLQLGVKYGIAHISDSTADQVYNGVEHDDVIKAVEATKGEVLLNSSGNLIAPYYSSNAGGMTANLAETWGGSAAYLKNVASPDDRAAKGKLLWYRLVLADGTAGYALSTYFKNTGMKNAAGLPYYESIEQGVNLRLAPFVNNVTNVAIAKLNIGDKAIMFDQTLESNAYNWQRGPFDAVKLGEQMNPQLPKPLASPLLNLSVSQRGTSGRVTELLINGQPIKLSRSDNFRTLLGGLPSTLFDIEETGRYTVLGANGVSRASTAANGELYAVHGALSGQKVSNQMFVMNAENKVRLATLLPQFIFTGKGYGHGLGMSQWGARAYAEQGNDYQKILKSYYSEVLISKE